MKRLLVCAMLALSALMAGCPESVHPVSNPARAAHDHALFGVWHGTFDGDEVYLHVGPGERGMTSATMVEHRKDGRVKTERYLAFPSRLERFAVLNVTPLDDARVRGYTLMKYEVAKKKLTLWMLSYGAARDDIKAGTLPGIAEDGQFGDTRITASSAELAAYLQHDQKRLFDKPLSFTRVVR